MYTKSVAAVIGLLAAGVAGAPVARAAVTVNVPCSTPALASAMTSASGDTLSLAAGCVYVLTTALPEISQDLTITGHGATLQRNHAPGTPGFAILQVTGVQATLAVSALTFRNGQPAISALDDSSLTVSDCAFTHNDGGLYTGSEKGLGAYTVTDSTFTANTGTAIFNNNFSGQGVAVAESTFTANTAGAIYDINATGSVVVGSRFYRNNSAVVFSSGGRELLSGDVFSGNDGAITGAEGGNGITIRDSIITGNQAGLGGGAYLQPGSAVIGSTIEGNSAGDGGGIYAPYGGVSLIDSIVLGNVPNNCAGGFVFGCANAGPVVSGYRTAKCVEDSGNSSANDTKIVMWDCNGSAAQSWTPEDDGTIRINGKCLDIYRDKKTSNAPVDLWTCTGGANQQWQPDNGALVNPVSGKCLDDPRYNVTNGTQLRIYTCHGGANQQWELPAQAASPPRARPPCDHRRSDAQITACRWPRIRRALARAVLR